MTAWRGRRHLLLHLSIELILVYVHKSTTFCQSLIIVYVVLHTDRYSCVTLTVGLRQLTGEATRRCGRAPDSSLSTGLLLTADVLKRAVSSFWLCEVRHFPGPAFSSPCDLDLHFPGLANSRAAIWSIIFQVLQFPVIVFCGPKFSGPANSAPPS